MVPKRKEMGEREIRRFGLAIIHYYVYKKNKQTAA